MQQQVILFHCTISSRIFLIHHLSRTFSSFSQIHSAVVRKRIYSSLSTASEAKLNVMHAAFLAVQYDPSDADILMRCQSMIIGLCREHFVMPSLEVGCPTQHLLCK